MAQSVLRICLVEPFYTGSHAHWADELVQRSAHHIELLTLPGRYWKWRMHGAAVTLAQRLLQSGESYDLILATDMLDVAVFAALIRGRHAATPIAVYFHENQLCYPWSPRDTDVKTKRDRHYAFINYTSALAADRVFFNSDYHRGAFLKELSPYLAAYPDFQNAQTVALIAAKSDTLPLGMDLAAFDEHRPLDPPAKQRPLLLWNHRWEYDKKPKHFFELLFHLIEQQIDFEVALLGESFAEEPPYFAEARRRLGQRIVAYGKSASFEEYARWLWRADILPVTSRQDFFGGSVVEAIYCDCHPLLPDRLAYPDHIDKPTRPDLFYKTLEGAKRSLAELISSGRWRVPPKLRSAVSRYDWQALASRYDATFSAVPLRSR